MVQSTVKLPKKAPQNVFVIGSLGAGKSTLISTLFFENYEQARQAEDFKTSKSLAGFTTDFRQKFTRNLQCYVTDSPGLGDKRIPLNLWIDNFNTAFKANPRVDICLVVIEKKERVDTNVVLSFQLLDETLGNMDLSNLCIVFNKADEDEDDVESVKAYYAEAFKQAECKNLPKPSSLNDQENILLLLRKKMGKKTSPMEDCVPEATALFDYVQEILVRYIVNKLEKCRPVEVKTTTFETIANRTKDEVLIKQLSEDRKFYQDNLAMMQRMMDNQTQLLVALATKNDVQMKLPPPEPPKTGVLASVLKKIPLLGGLF